MGFFGEEDEFEDGCCCGDDHEGGQRCDDFWSWFSIPDQPVCMVVGVFTEDSVAAIGRESEISVVSKGNGVGYDVWL